MPHQASSTLPRCPETAGPERVLFPRTCDLCRKTDYLQKANLASLVRGPPSPNQRNNGLFLCWMDGDANGAGRTPWASSLIIDINWSVCAAAANEFTFSVDPDATA